MPTRDRRRPLRLRRATPSEPGRVCAQADAPVSAAPPASPQMILALWRPGRAPRWLGGEPGDPSLAEAQALFADPAARDARRDWTASSDRGADLWWAHPQGLPARLHECTMALPAGAANETFVTAFIFSGARGVQSTDMMANRRARRVLRARIEAALDGGAPVATLAFGVDNLSEMNRTFGFGAADSVLAEVAARIREAAARALPGRATVRHLSGSKFGLVAAGLDGAQARSFARKAQDLIASSPIATEQGAVAATVSAGVATHDPGEGAHRDALGAQASGVMARALDLLGAARRDGPSGLAESRVGANAGDRLEEGQRQARDAMTALQEGRIGLAFQPIVTSGSRRPAFHESLARMFGRDGAVIPAAAFIPAIERLGQVRLLDRRMLAAVLDALEDSPRARLSLNVSRQTLRDGEWMRVYQRRSAQAPRAAERLIIEITESSASCDPAATLEFISAVRARGAAVALDDFGAGYTALRQLRDFRFDFLKIDGSFAADIASDPDNRLFVRIMVDIARHFDMPTVAEFVETEAQASALAALGVTYQQGYLHGAPTLRLEPERDALTA